MPGALVPVADDLRSAAVGEVVGGGLNDLVGARVQLHIAQSAARRRRPGPVAVVCDSLGLRVDFFGACGRGNSSGRSRGRFCALLGQTRAPGCAASDGLGLGRLFGSRSLEPGAGAGRLGLDSILGGSGTGSPAAGARAGAGGSDRRPRRFVGPVEAWWIPSVPGGCCVRSASSEADGATSETGIEIVHRLLVGQRGRAGVAAATTGSPAADACAASDETCDSPPLGVEGGSSQRSSSCRSRSSAVARQLEPWFRHRWMLSAPGPSAKAPRPGVRCRQLPSLGRRRSPAVEDPDEDRPRPREAVAADPVAEFLDETRPRPVVFEQQVDFGGFAGSADSAGGPP